MEPNTATSIPKRIWIMWLQGLKQAPYLVQECYKSWQTLNPGWEIIFLDETNVHEYVDLRPIMAKQTHIEKAALSDIIRVKLLARYGGVWVDATSYCQVPLDGWLDDYLEAGFFAFHSPDHSRLLTVWFLASTPNNYLLKRWAEATDAYMLENPQLARRPKIARLFKWLYTNTNTTRYWFVFPIRRILKIYPYYWFMYLFTDLVQKDSQSLQLWKRTKKFDAETPLSLYKLGLLSPLTERIKNEIDEKKVPVYKLTWKPAEQVKHSVSNRRSSFKTARGLDKSRQYDGSILNYLLMSDRVKTTNKS